MKNRKIHASKTEKGPVETFADLSSDEMMEDVVGTKVLYNWQYRQEEENYCLNEKDFGPPPYFLEEEGLFVESASFSHHQ